MPTTGITAAFSWTGVGTYALPATQTYPGTLQIHAEWGVTAMPSGSLYAELWDLPGLTNCAYYYITGLSVKINGIPHAITSTARNKWGIDAYPIFSSITSIVMDITVVVDPTATEYHYTVNNDSGVASCSVADGDHVYPYMEKTISWTLEPYTTLVSATLEGVGITSPHVFTPLEQDYTLAITTTKTHVRGTLTVEYAGVDCGNNGNAPITQGGYGVIAYDADNPNGAHIEAVGIHAITTSLLEVGTDSGVWGCVYDWRVRVSYLGVKVNSAGAYTDYISGSNTPPDASFALSGGSTWAIGVASAQDGICCFIFFSVPDEDFSIYIKFTPDRLCTNGRDPSTGGLGKPKIPPLIIPNPSDIRIPSSLIPDGNPGGWPNPIPNGGVQNLNDLNPNPSDSPPEGGGGGKKIPVPELDPYRRIPPPPPPPPSPDDDTITQTIVWDLEKLTYDYINYKNNVWNYPWPFYDFINFTWLSDGRGLIIKWRDNGGKWSKEHEISTGERGDTNLMKSLTPMGTYKTRQYQLILVGRAPLVVVYLEEENEQIEPE